MKKEMLKCNVIFYGIQYSLSLLYVGYEFGLWNWTYILQTFNLRKDLRRVEDVLTWLALPTIYLILRLIGRRIYEEREYCTGKSYYTMAAVTLVYSAWVWVKLYEHSNRWHEIGEGLKLGGILYPAVMAFFSVVIAVFYIVCAVKTAKENKKYKQNLNADRT